MQSTDAARRCGVAPPSLAAGLLPPSVIPPARISACRSGPHGSWAARESRRASNNRDFDEGHSPPVSARLQLSPGTGSAADRPPWMRDTSTSPPGCAAAAAAAAAAVAAARAMAAAASRHRPPSAASASPPRLPTSLPARSWPMPLMWRPRLRRPP